MFLLIYVFNAFAPLTTVRDSSERVSLNGIDFLENILSSHVATNTAFSNSELGVIITGGSSFLLSLAGITLLFFAFRSTLKDKKITSIILTSVAYLVLIITAVLSLVAAMLAYSNDTYVYSFASGVITALVFLQFVIAGLIVSAAISKKKAE